MSSSTLTTIQTQLTLYGYSIPMILGTIGNILIIIMLGRQPQNTCAIYLISSSIMNNLFLIFNGFVQIMPFNYSNLTPTEYVFCKIRLYLPSVLGQTARTTLVFACIDRFIITSDRAFLRTLSTPKQAKYLIVFSIIFWSLFGIHIPIMVTIVNGQCSIINGIYSGFYTFYVIVFNGLMPPIMMSIFGYLTYRNMRKRNIRVQPVTQYANTANITVRRRDRNLLIIVISEVFVYVLAATPVPFVLLEMTISRYILSSKSIQYSQIESFIFSIASLLLSINNAAPFYIYLIASKSFRRDFKQLLINTYKKLTRLG